MKRIDHLDIELSTEALGYLDLHQHAPWAKYSLLVSIKHLMNHTLINMVLRAYRAK